MQFRVTGFIDGMPFDQTFDSVADWRRERRAIEALYRVDVRSMVSVQVAA